MGALQVYMHLVGEMYGLYLCPHSDPVTQHVHRVRDTIKVRLTYLSIYVHLYISICPLVGGLWEQPRNIPPHVQDSPMGRS